MYTRNWHEFWLNTIKSLKTVGITSSLVPVFFFLMNPNFHQTNFFTDLVFSSRIGLQISIFSWLCFTFFYAFIYYTNPTNLLKIKQSIKTQSIMGLSFMLIGLGLTSLIEPYISGRNFGLDSISIGTLMGGTTFLLCIFYVGHKRTQEVNLKLKIESAEANLHVLNNQMQPHFLFNSLNSLAELIESNHESASKVTQSLADLYRQILENSKRQVSSLESEISLVNKYMELEKLRYEERLNYTITTPIDLTNIYLPSLVLQTLVENAIKHGISKSITGGKIAVQLTKAENNGYYLTVLNTGTPYNPKECKGTGITNTQARLELLYGKKHNFTIQTSDMQTKVSFWFSGEAFGI